MSNDQIISNLGEEKYAFYAGTAVPAFVPIAAGITLPDPNYIIHRTNADIYVFEYILDGKGYVCQNQEKVKVQAGDAYILQPGRLHYYYPDKKEPWTKIWFNVRGSFVRHLLSDYGLSEVFLIPALNQAHYLYDIFNTIEKEPGNCCNNLALLLHQYIQVLSVFCGNYAKEHSQAFTMKSFIEQNLTRPLSIEEIAASAHLSRSRALHLFKEAYGIPPYRYYLTQRLELAQSMLHYTTLSIQEISDRLGFADYNHFSNLFKKECGVSPMQYRKA